MKKFIVVIVALCLAGCVSGSVNTEVVLDDGSLEKCTAEYSSFWKDSTAADVGACGAFGNVEGSTSNDILMQLFMKALTTP